MTFKNIRMISTQSSSKDTVFYMWVYRKWSYLNFKNHRIEETNMYSMSNVKILNSRERKNTK